MKVIDTINLVVKVDGEGDPVQALVAHTTPETPGVVRFPHSLKNMVSMNTIMQLCSNKTGLKKYQ